MVYLLAISRTKIIINWPRGCT